MQQTSRFAVRLAPADCSSKLASGFVFHVEHLNMQFWRERDLVFQAQPSEEELGKERLHQVSIVGLGFGVYFATHRLVSRLKFFRPRPMLPQFIAVVPALAAMYVEGVRMRWKTVKNLRA